MLAIPAVGRVSTIKIKPMTAPFSKLFQPFNTIFLPPFYIQPSCTEFFVSPSRICPETRYFLGSVLVGLSTKTRPPLNPGPAGGLCSRARHVPVASLCSTKQSRWPGLQWGFVVFVHINLLS